MQINLNVTISADPVLLAALQALSAGKTVSQTTAAEPKKVKKEQKTEATEDVKPSPLAIASNGVSNLNDLAHSDTAGQHTLESLRALAVPKSRAGKKDEIKAWLTEAGYPDGLATLQPKDFDAFYSFIEKL